MLLGKNDRILLYLLRRRCRCDDNVYVITIRDDVVILGINNILYFLSSGWFWPKNYETASKLVQVMPRILRPFSGHGVYRRKILFGVIRKCTITSDVILPEPETEV